MARACRLAPGCLDGHFVTVELRLCNRCERSEAAASRTRFDELGVLVTVAEAGSLSAAAKQLGVPKSTVGRAIARLEEELGVSLVRRMARGPALTEPGLVLANRAAPHIAGLRDAAAAQGRESQEAYGLLRVTAPADVGAHLIAPLLPGFFARHPRVRVEIENTLRVVDLVREGFDLADPRDDGAASCIDAHRQEARAA